VSQFNKQETQSKAQIPLTQFFQVQDNSQAESNSLPVWDVFSKEEKGQETFSNARGSKRKELPQKIQNPKKRKRVNSAPEMKGQQSLDTFFKPKHADRTTK
jgi:hypothetical protein